MPEKRKLIIEGDEQNAMETAFFTEICTAAALELAAADVRAAETAPAFIPSAAFERKMRRLAAHVKNDRYVRLTTAAKIALVAALLALLALSVYAGHRIASHKLLDRGLYTRFQIGKSDGVITDGLTVGYIPEGFEKTDEFIGKKGIVFEYQNADGLFFDVTKKASYDIVDIETESRPPKEITIGNTIYTIYGREEYPGIIWYKGAYLYIIGGNLTEEELLKIAESVR